MTPDELRQAAAEVAALKAEARRTELEPRCDIAVPDDAPLALSRSDAERKLRDASPRMASLIAAQAERIRQLEESRAEREEKISKEFDAFREFTETQHALVAELRATIASQAAAICVLAAMVPEGATLNSPADITNTISAAIAAKGSGNG